MEGPRTSRSTRGTRVRSTLRFLSAHTAIDNSSTESVSPLLLSSTRHTVLIVFCPSHTVVDTLEINESRPRAIRATFHSKYLNDPLRCRC